MKFRVYIDGISIDGLAWSASERCSFERSFAAALEEVIASQAGIFVPASIGRRAGFESLSIGIIDARDPRSVARALASPLVTHVLTSPGQRSAGTANAGAT